jgi:hypothetical protein
MMHLMVAEEALEAAEVVEDHDDALFVLVLLDKALTFFPGG